VAIKLNTRVFKLYKGKYRNLVKLAHAMGILRDLIYRVRKGERGVNQKFIIEAIKASPRHKLDDFFYASEGSQDDHR